MMPAQLADVVSLAMVELMQKGTFDTGQIFCKVGL